MVRVPPAPLIVSSSKDGAILDARQDSGSPDWVSPEATGELAPRTGRAAPAAYLHALAASRTLTSSARLGPSKARSGPGFQQCFEVHELLVIRPPHPCRHHRRTNLCEPARLPAVVQRHTSDVPTRRLPRISRLHRERSFGSPHHEPL